MTRRGEFVAVHRSGRSLLCAFSVAMSMAWVVAAHAADDGRWTPMGAVPDLTFNPYGHTAIYATSRDRMVTYGGDDIANSDIVGLLTLGPPLGAPGWNVVAPGDSSPGGLADHAAVYDPLRDKMLVIGGDFLGLPYSNDVWSASTFGTPWVKLAPAGLPPPPRYGLSAVYDSLADRVIVFGGSGATGYLNDVWALNLDPAPEWVELTPTGTPPAPRRFHSAIFDMPNNRMIVFGGEQPSGSAGYDDVWELSLNGTPAWTLLTPTGTGPSARAFATAIVDPIRGRMVVFGGGILGASPVSNNDTWALDLAGSPAWSELSPDNGQPAPRTGHTAIYDPVRDQMVVCGGRGISGTEKLWALDWKPSGAPVVSCPGPVVRTTGPNVVCVNVSNLMAGGTGYLVKVSDTRGWADTTHLDIEVPLSGPVCVNVTVVVPDMASPEPDSVSCLVVWVDDPSLRDSCTFELIDASTPTLPDWREVDAEGGRVVLRWLATDVRGAAIVQRRDDATDWAPIGRALEDGRDAFVYIDRSVEIGRRYGYRLATPTANGVVYSSERWVEVSGLRAGLRWSRVWPQPAGDRVQATLAASEPGPVRVELFDLAGRRVRSVSVAVSSAGDRAVSIDTQGLVPGLYRLRARSGSSEVSTTVIVAR